MDIGAFLKIALYRVIFVLIVGIPAVEVFSFLLFDNGIVIQKVTDETINGSVKLRFNEINLGNSGHFIPGNFYFNGTGTRTNQNYPLEIEVPKADIQVKDPLLVVKNPEIIELGKFKFTIRNLSTIGWIFYLIIAWILGEVLSFLGDLFIGYYFFRWNPFREDQNLEKITPNTWRSISIKYFLTLASNEGGRLILEMSEVHFVISRVFGGISLNFGFFFILILYKLNKYLGLLVEFLFIWLVLLFLCDLLNYIKRIILLELIINISFGISLLFFRSITLPEVLIITITSILLSTLVPLLIIIYRTHANRLIYWGARKIEENQSNQSASERS